MKIVIDIEDDFWIIKNVETCWILDKDLPLHFYDLEGNKKLDYINNNNLFHREDGPARIDKYGNKEWYLHGRCHRINGPAVIRPHGIKGWYLNDIKVNGEIYQKIQNSSKEELLVYMIDPEYKDYLSLIEYQLNKK